MRSYIIKCVASRHVANRLHKINHFFPKPDFAKELLLAVSSRFITCKHEQKDMRKVCTARPQWRQPGGSTAAAAAAAAQWRQFCSRGQLGGGGGSSAATAAWRQHGRSASGLAAVRPRRQLGHGQQLGSHGGQLGSGGGSLAASRPRRRQRQHGRDDSSLGVVGSLAAGAAAWRHRGHGGGSLAAARPRQRQHSSSSSSSAAAAKSSLRFRKKSPQKIGVTWNLLIAVAYNNILVYFYVR
jgi:hypothetical protein